MEKFPMPNVKDEDVRDTRVRMKDPFMDVKVPEGEPTIFNALRFGDDDMVEQQIREGFNINLEFTDGTCRVKGNKIAHRVQTSHYTALHIAALHSTCQIIERLLEHGADINILDEQLRTALHFAVVANRMDVIKLLILKGADINIQSCSGRSPLLESIINGNFDIARVLIEAGANPDLLDIKGTSVLHQLCFSRDPNLDMIRLILENKGNPNITNRKGATPIMFAVTLKRHFSVQVIKLLLDYGASINMTDKQGRSVIHFTVEHKSTFTGVGNILLFLIQQGASINSPDQAGKYVLDHAMRSMALSSVKILLRCDCPRDVQYIMTYPQMVHLCDVVPEFREWLISELYAPRSLMRLCRSTIRTCLSPDNLTNVHTLDIPRQLQDFILCRNLRAESF